MPLYDDERKYTVKETAQIIGVNAQTLRYYDRIGLIEPLYRDPDNQYRYYTINQFYQIEMFQLAKELGLPLSEYGSVLFTDEQLAERDFAELEETLSSLEQETVRERERLDARLDEISRMRRNVARLKKQSINGAPFYETLPERCVYVVDHDPARPFEDTSVRMRKTRGKYREYLTEQYGFLLDAEAASHGKLEITKQFVQLNRLLPESDDIVRIPGGTYASFLYHGFCPEEPTDSLEEYLATRRTAASYLVADEVGYFDRVRSIIHAVRVPLDGQRDAASALPTAPS